MGGSEAIWNEVARHGRNILRCEEEVWGELRKPMYHRTGSRGIPEVLGIRLHEPEGKAVGESDELIRNPRRDLRMISTLRDICSTKHNFI